MRAIGLPSKQLTNLRAALKLSWAAKRAAAQVYRLQMFANPPSRPPCSLSAPLLGDSLSTTNLVWYPGKHYHNLILLRRRFV